MTLEVFEASDRFRLQRSLGTGGFGVVYEAYDSQRHARVALKLLRHADPGGLFRLKREFRTLADLSHPNLVMLHELVADREPWFIVMELVDGVDFLSYIVSAKFLQNAEDLTGVDGLSPDEETGALVAMPRPVRASREIACDLDRFQTIARQLVDALVYLHGAGRLHCDIKPSNVLVRADGVLKVLDFGLTSELSPETIVSRRRTVPDTGRISGTPAYMSPEQALTQPLTAASDWYSVGVMFFESLTGVRPFTGPLADVQQLKTQQDGPSPSTLVDGLPPELDDLVRALLKRTPAERPDGADVAARLRKLSSGDRVMAPATPSMPRGVFVGRDREMAALVSAAAMARGGHTVVAKVHGGSGMGKTALVTRFLEQQRAAHHDTVVFAGRCYEREAVPYKALDNVVDELSQYLRQLGRDAEPLIPRDAAALARLFPVLRRVEPIALSRERLPDVPDSQDLRRRGFAAFRELVARLSRTWPVVVFIDDLHWGDTDSAALLIELLRPPAPPPLLLVLAYRTEEAATSAALQMILSQLDAMGALERREIALEELTEDQARDLAERLIGGDAAQSRAEAIAHESGRSPFFISELARYARAGGRTAELVVPRPGESGTAPLTLETMLVAEMRGLAPPARRLLEVLAVFGRPLRAPLASRAANLGGDEIDALTSLRTAHLARVRVTDTGRAVEVYHDRIRETVLGHLEPTAIRGLHATLAHVLEAERDADAETLFTHFAGAGDADRAAHYAIAAGDRAGAALAFDRAAELYRAALGLRPAAGDAAGRRDLQVKLADALAAGGRGREAALVYLDAASGAQPSRALELRRRAAEHLLRSGYLDEGYRVVDTVLQAMRLRLARTPLTALLSLVWRRFLIRVRGLGFTPRDESAIAPESLVRVDACWSVATALGVVDTIRGADFQGRHLLLALQIGDRYRIARALAVEAIYASAEGEHARDRSERLIARADALAHDVGHPHALALVAMIRGASAFLQGRWPAARQRLELAEPYLRESAGAWQIDTHLYHLYYLLTLFNLGEVNEVVRRMPLLVAEARERDDLTAATSLRTRAGYLPPLAADDPDTARREVRDAMARWPRTGFHAQHSWELYALGEILLYTSCGADAWQFVAERWPALRRSMLLRIQGARIESTYLRARAALAAAGDSKTSPADRERRLADAERDARSLSRESAGWARAAAEMVRAGIAVAQGRPDDAIAGYARAASAFDAAYMTLHAHIARRRRGELLPGPEGAAIVAAADQWMTLQGIKNPVRWAAMLAPTGTSLEVPGRRRF